MFFKSYSEKLWGIPCDQLDADFAAQRIKKFSLGEAIKAALGIGGNGHKTLVDQFAYPTGGTGMVYERMAQRVEETPDGAGVDGAFATAPLPLLQSPVAAEINTAGSRQRAPFLVRVLDPAGATIGQTTGMERLLPANIFPPVPSREIAAPTEHRVAGKSFALTTRRALADGHQFTIQVAQDRSSDEQVERKFGIVVLVVLSGSILASILIAIPVTRRGLRPLEEMKRSLERIGPTHLNERVAPANWPRELQPLAIAFDEMLKRLDDSFTRLSQFSADLAHELRTPIANMLGEAQVALSRDRSAAEYRETIESTIGECERLSGIVDNLLFVARADAATEPVERIRFDARAAVEKIAAFYETIAEDRHVAINCSGQGQISADPALFERAVGNLVDNALRFVPENGSIEISLADSPTDFEVAVSDNGSGIAPEHLPRVFDRFYRAESSRGSDGAGLGLALVKSIVDLHGGTARIQSELGSGTVVTLTFPNRT
jgi:two-component system heavy metal sensor histidine kinase CusS